MKKKTHERNWSLENVASFFFTQMFEYFSRCVELEVLLSIPAPPPRSPLLANHGTTPLYLGHCNMLPLSPMADALCRNLRRREKRGWWVGGEELTTEGGNFPSFLPKKGKNSSSLFCDFLPVESIFCSPASRRLPSPAFICLSE